MKSKNVIKQSEELSKLVAHQAPMNYDAEVSVLSAMMLSQEAVSKVIGIFANDNNLSNKRNSKETSVVFYDKRNNEIYKAILALYEKNIIPDIVSLQDYLNGQGTLESIGGIGYLVEVSNKVSTAAYVETHAKLVQEYYFRRCLIELAEDILRNSYDTSTDILDEIDKTESNVFAIAEKRIRKNYKTMDFLAQDAVKLIQTIHGELSNTDVVTTGFAFLDNLLGGGLQKSELIILAARPSMGKTALALSISLNVALADKKVAFFSLEMDSKQLVLRMLSSMTMLPLGRVGQRLSDKDWKNIARYASKLRELKLYFDDSSTLSIMELRSKCRRLKAEHQIDLIVIDYLQLLQSIKADSREREVAIISATLKQIARELDVPVLALAQLSRAVENRPGKDKRPLLSDLRESGSLEQDADVVMFIHRPEYYEKNTSTIEANSWKNLAEIIIGKHRNGPTGIVNLSFIPEFVKFTERDSQSNIEMPVLPPDDFSNSVNQDIEF